ncbi:hypothetical protein [Streptomyces vietnamensis]|nr:hypothetical protein [Streptomyces vietnamensis]
MRQRLVVAHELLPVIAERYGWYRTGHAPKPLTIMPLSCAV